MFTGIVEGMGRVIATDHGRLTLALPIKAGIKKGASLAVNGCCLSAVSTGRGRFTADLSPETLHLTALGDLKKGDRVNLERPIRLQSMLGGHLVQGHVDGVGQVTRIVPEGSCKAFTFRIPAAVARFCIAKGSIAIDGVSLTLNRIEGRLLQVMIIPETLQKTNFGRFAVGRRVNLEVDIIAKYVAKLIGWRNSGRSS